jgi:hypothetical protein
MLSEIDFKLVSTDISFSQEETSPLTALLVLDRLINGRAGTLDIRV